MPASKAHRHKETTDEIAANLMAAMSGEELIKAASNDLDCEDEGGFTRYLLDLSGNAAWAVLNLLQLALTHPEVGDALGKLGREGAQQLEEQICTTAALKEMARRGWERRP